MANELVRLPVTIIATTGGEPAALAAKAATSSIPIVFAVGSDPVKLGLTASINRPGGSATAFFDTRRKKLVALAARNAVPAIYHFREYADDGGLMSYGLNFVDVYRLVGVYTGNVLKGAKPSELPVMQATKFEFVINLKTAKALGVQISDNLLSLADAVIE
jgi:ABC-type uncharacterized transport system substrate-binding protein